MDETRFRTGVGKAQWIISTHKVKKFVMIDPDNRDYITSTECISAGGRVLPPLVILQRRLILDKWAYSDLNKDSVLAFSDSGYSNEELALGQLKHFDQHTKKLQQGDWRCLILDDYGSHLTYEFWKYASVAKIWLWRLIPHSTHLTQHLDIGCFQPMKHWHQEVLDKVCRAGEVDFAKDDFLAEFEGIRRKTSKETTIKNAFLHTGLILYNPEVIKKIFAEKNERRLRDVTPPRQQMANSLNETPEQCQTVTQYGRTLKGKLDCMEPVTHNQLNRFIKGTTAMAYYAELTQDENRRTRDYQKIKRARKEAGSKVAQKGGLITVGNLRAKVQAQEHDAVLKAKRDMGRAEKAMLRARREELLAINVPFQPFQRRYIYVNEVGQ